ncbi:3-demethylubiquinone-9 3-methyltransferase domain protein [Leptospira broomii serovar Hurstbridge str. 5399]|uniref:3-demethylubiquinone-9 3-methyltransferase domain protein n=1 Tax=Leptospira broomii serovar Hurstbridge str. 5399 TaxID=1049789 RepID=T0FGR9_9LEPT|nr:VOC family protein [Leptospira broomii]EQA46822.1 3-demethylubiquinone-9 3-methyltransferase domain protein [Leptospira broomii serovar Hurstbridge str. 5399]
MKKITPFLMFDNNLGAAVELYTSSFQNSRVESRNGSGETMQSATFSLNGQEFLTFNGGPHFKFTPAISFFVNCKTSDEVDQLWSKLSKDGLVFMELNAYPFSEKFGWVQDRFGVSWQLNLSKEEQKIYPFLLFSGKQEGRAEEAIGFYTSQFPDSNILNIQRYATSEGKKEGTVKRSTFSLCGQEFMAIDSAIPHPFTFSEAISLFARCETQTEIDERWETLSAGGKKQKCGWLKDKFGVSWQIIPPTLGEMLQDKDPQKSQRVLSAMLKMDKIDIAELKRAYIG